MTDRELVLTEILPVELINRNDGQGHSWHRTASQKLTIQRKLRGFKRKPFSFRVDVVMTRILKRRQKLLDPDSLGRGNAKQIVDVLTKLGWWHDDSAKHIGAFDYRQDATQRASGPIVKIEVYRSAVD